MDLPLLETRRGHSQTTREIPPSVVAVAINIHKHKPPSLTVDIRRPVKLTLTPKLITKLSEFSDSILKPLGSQHGMESLSTPTPAEVAQDKTGSQKLQSKKNDSESHVSANAVETGDGTGNALQVKVKVMQVLVEFQISTRCLDLTDGDCERELCVTIEGEVEEQPDGAVSIAEEGFVLAWNHLDLTYPNVSGKDSTLLPPSFYPSLPSLSLLP